MLMTILGSAAGLALQPAPPPDLNLTQRTSLRCATALAVVSGVQERGGAKEYPPLGERGREYFVRSIAQLMDETGANREQVQSLVQSEARTLEDPAELDTIMPACLQLLDQSGL